MKKKVIAAVGLGYAAWALFVLCWSGSFAAGTSHWGMEQFGQFGDSFGLPNAVMVSVAALFTWQALQHDRQQSNQTSAEETFFRLLETRSRLLNQVEYNEKIGVEAFALMQEAILGDGIPSVAGHYEHLHREASNVLHTYYRITYHALTLIRDRFDAERGYGFAQILRAELSSPEQFLIGVNAAWRYPKMLKLVENFSLLHTMPMHDWVVIKAVFPAVDESAWKSKSKRDGEAD